MKRIDLIEEKLSRLSAEAGVTAGELAASLGLSRANVSNDLNRLCAEGKAEKYGSKPVYYRISHTAARQDAETQLNAFVRNNQSMFHCVEQAKAAVLYPPNGMHILLFGETGTGKSMFAELIYKYVKEKGYLADKAPFIVFNCADYSDNPQLLVSQLMGTKKGAYTGADSDRPGLLEKADGGILFLDEVHRLPPQGQEMLFTFMDKGIYRRLGETDAERRAKVLIICATTEDPQSNLLNTFVRRIPMIIRIPNLSERSIDERLNLISGFFTAESARLRKPISVSVNSMRSLLSYHCPNNVGQLKNDIQIICAKAYSDYASRKRSELCIISHDLPDYVRQGLGFETTHRQIWKRFIGINKRFCVFNSESHAAIWNDNDMESIYGMIDTHMQELKDAGTDETQIKNEIDRDIQLYFEKYTKISESTKDFPSIRNLVGMDIIYIVDRVLIEAEEKLNRNFEENVRYGLAVHVYSSINRIRQGRKIVNPQLNVIRKNLPAEFSVALSSLEIINEKFKVNMPIDEAGFLAVFFDLNRFHRSAKVRVIVIAHGNSTATSMAETANRLLDINYTVGINASLDENSQNVYLKLKEFLKKSPSEAGVLLLVDMGSLMNFPEDIEKELGIQTKAIPLVSTLHVIDAARKAALGYPLDYIYQETLRVNELLSEANTNLPAKDQFAKLFILTICTTGEGSAALLKNVLDSQLNYHNSMCEAISLKLTDQNDFVARLSTISKIGKILCIVSTFQVDFPVPHFNLTEVLEGSAIPSIQKLIDHEAILSKLGQTFSSMLKYGDSETVLRSIHSVIAEIEVQSGQKLLPDVLVGVLCHLGCMLDRLIGSQPISKFPQRETYIQQNKAFFYLVKKACDSLNSKFSIVVPDDEICNIMRFFAPENCENDGGDE
ncbi:sigma 54-interacting transcriptional regulator [Paenibacillus lutimineralis]|uniref:Sigma-54-dependent transcriptional regulator n=1 Tax=Paenibacillus lutimineralis TaxID=2707005 RepID=A0A3Q9I7F9_9BACL|nr:sigma-54-dependent transcriptional regulator [Paenibacillus lutimineralis]AZS14305.1 sigma-54-dependent transcriptional regulator [Paenibacillus lutimineralis]